MSFSEPLLTLLCGARWDRLVALADGSYLIIIVEWATLFNTNLLFRTTHCYGCCSKGNGFIKRFFYAKLYFAFYSMWWNLFLPPSLRGHSCSLYPARLSKYQGNTFLLFPPSAIWSRRISRGSLILFQWSFFSIPHLKRQNKQTFVFVLTPNVISTFPPHAHPPIHPVRPLLLPPVASSVSWWFLHVPCTIIHLFIAR